MTCQFDIHVDLFILPFLFCTLQNSFGFVEYFQGMSVCDMHATYWKIMEIDTNWTEELRMLA